MLDRHSASPWIKLKPEFPFWNPGCHEYTPDRLFGNRSKQVYPLSCSFSTYRTPRKTAILSLSRVIFRQFAFLDFKPAQKWLDLGV
jgi:hypothetical protein